MKVRYQSIGRGRVVGSISVPTSTPGKLIAEAVGSDKAEALARAAAIMQRVVDDPVMRAIMPEAAEDDIAQLRDLASAALDGPAAVLGIYSELAGRGKRKLAKHLHRESKMRRDGDDDNGDDDNGDDSSDLPRDVVNGRGPEVSGFWDDVSNIATKVGTEAWKQAKAHRKEIAMAAAGVALGPAGAVAAGKAMDLVTAAQGGDPVAKAAVAQVAQKAKAGDPKAKTMIQVITREVKHDAVQAAATPGTPPAAQPVDPEPENDGGYDEHHDEGADIERDHGEDTDIMHDADNGGES